MDQITTLPKETTTLFGVDVRPKVFLPCESLHAHVSPPTESARWFVHLFIACNHPPFVCWFIRCCLPSSFICSFSACRCWFVRLFVHCLQSSSFVHSLLAILVHSFARSVLVVCCLFVRLFVRCYSRSLLRCYRRLFVSSCGVACYRRLFVHSSVAIAVRSFDRSFVAIMVLSFVPSFVCSFVARNLRLFILWYRRSFIRWYRRSFVHSFIYCYRRSFVPSLLVIVVRSASCLFCSTSITEALHTKTTAPPAGEVDPKEKNMMERNALQSLECFDRMLAELWNVVQVPLSKRL